MAFPGRYNFEYYKGDTFEFNLYPKTPSGEIFDLDDFDSVVFNASTVRDAPAEEIIPFSASFSSPDKSYIICKITPTQGLLLNSNQRYLYDVQINNGTDIVYTLIDGTISVTGQISPNPIPQAILPGNPKNLAVSQSTQLNKILVTVDWETPDAISGAETITGYKVYVVDGQNSILVSTITNPSTTAYSTTSVTFPAPVGTIDIMPGSYTIKVTTVAGTLETTGSTITKAIVAPPGPVQNLTISDRTLDSATITWTAPASPSNTQTGYILGYNDNPELTDTFEDFVPVLTYAAAPNTTTHTFTGLTALTPYTFAVVPIIGQDVVGFPDFETDSVES